MKRVESGQGATDLGSLEAVPVLVPGEPGVVEVVQEIDNLRACVADVREWALPMAGSLRAEQVLSILEKHGL